MADLLRIVQLNLAYDAQLATPDELLARYHTLTGWSRALAGAGAHVHVIQRFGADAHVDQDGVRYQFVQDGEAGMPSPWSLLPRIADAVRHAEPDIVHVNGLMFPGVVQALRRSLPLRLAIVLQDHSGFIPRAGSWPLKQRRIDRWREAFTLVDAVTFTSAALSERWHEVGLPDDARILEIPEASTAFSPIDRDTARRRTGIGGSPALLWVGRLDRNKDPMTLLAGIALAVSQVPDYRCWMIYNSEEIEGQVKAFVATSPGLRDRVELLGSIPHDRLHEYYSAADIFVSGSHHEGSGYALIEALACGLTPCVTDIPAFRILTGACGARWPPGNANACAAALVDLAMRDLVTERILNRDHFERTLTWNAIGRQTISAYQALVQRRALDE